MSALTLINDATEWDAYKVTSSRNFEISPADPGWRTPQQYPCLAAAIVTDDNKLNVCWVYISDALLLLKAAGYQAYNGSDRVAEVDASPEPDVMPEPVTSPNTAFEKHVSAMLMALVDELSEVGVLKPHLFEKAMVRHIANVDQFHEEDKEVAAERHQVLRKLFPREEE